MKRKATFGVVLALAAAPAIVAPTLVSQAQAQDAAAARAEYPDVPRGHWAYEALDRLSRAGIIEGRPGGVYEGNRPMTRYEFAVAIARLLDRLPPDRGGNTVVGPTIDQFNALTARVGALEARPIPDITRREVTDMINALATEFRDELSRLGVRVDAIEVRVSTLENRVSRPPRVTLTPSILHRTGSASYIDNGPGGIGRFIANPGFNPANDNVFGAQITPSPANPGGGGRNVQPRDSVFNDFNAGKFGYTDFELRLTDRVTDRLSVNAAFRSLGSTQEDPWTGDVLNGVVGGGFYLREANAVADLGGRSFLGARGLSLILGRQRTKVGQGLLYDNDLAPTDQLHAQFNVGPLQINGFYGGINNNNFGGNGLNPYIFSGSAFNVGLNGGGNVFGGLGPAAGSGAAVGFPGPEGVTLYPEDSESLVRVGFNLFRIAGNPVQVGVARQFDGVGDQDGDSLDLTIPLFNRTVGFEYVRQNHYANGAEANDAGAYNVTVPVLRSRILDLNAAYGKADDKFEYFLSSAANPYARTYAEAIFDRPMALGAPLIGEAPGGGDARYMAAKEVYDFTGTLRLLRRLPLDFRYYRAKGSERGRGDQVDLGNVFTVGSTFNISPGVDLEVKYGQYDSENAAVDKLKYFRVGANVGF
ncbi:MAG TPA: S-layer homology domain-containing protein [Abditibacteriaceae bacterium]|jgi:hypothetical protein